jgi:hypothetical protein
MIGRLRRIPFGLLPRSKVSSVRAKLLANGRGRWLAVVASVGVSAAIIYAQGAEPADRAQIPPAPPTVPVAAPVGTPEVASPAEVELLAASAPTPGTDIPFALPAGIAPEQGLQVRTIWAARAISVMFPEITTIGGARQDALKWHPNGLAIDVMIPNYHSEEGIELGNQIAGLALANAKRWGVLHVIWRQGFYPGIGAPSWTADYGSETANHYDHVHIATAGGGYPTGRETYFIASMNPAPPN